MASVLDDIQELKLMLEKATRPNVRSELQRILSKLESELATSSTSAKSEAEASENKAPISKTSAPVAAVPPEVAKLAHVEVKRMGPWTEITTFALDLGGYKEPLVTVDIRLKGVEALPTEAVTCDFTESSFDLKVVGLDGGNYRFLKTNLDKDIVPSESRIKVKKNHIIITLQKVKGEYGYDSWTDLTAKGGKRRKPNTNKENPQDSLMDMMKDLYDDGDDNMKKLIGEAMLKSRTGEKYDPKMDDLKMPSGLDDDLDGTN